jgi:hypothetical protein
MPKSLPQKVVHIAYQLGLYSLSQVAITTAVVNETSIRPCPYPARPSPIPLQERNYKEIARDMYHIRKQWHKNQHKPEITDPTVENCKHPDETGHEKTRLG